MTRKEKFYSLENRPHYNRLFKRLNKSDILIIEKFIEDHDHLDYSRFEHTLNRFFLFRDKPKNFTMILEFLMISNMK